MSLDVQSILSKVKNQLNDDSHLRAAEESVKALPEKPVTEIEKQLVTFISARYYLSDQYPDEEALLTKFPFLTPSSLRNELKEVNRILVTKRNLPPCKLTPLEDDEVDPEFLIAIDLVSDALDKRTLAAKMKQIGRTTKWFQNQMMVPIHKRLLESRVNSSYALLPELSKISLVRNVEAGDLQSMKYAEEKLGIFRPQQQSMIDFGKVISQFMEILVQYLPPEKLVEVADRMEAIISLPDTNIKELEN